MPDLIFIFNLVLFAVIAFFIERRQSPTTRPVFGPALGVKLLAGIALGWLYREYYSSADTFYFFEVAKEKISQFSAHKAAYLEFLWQDNDTEWKGAARSIFFIKLVSLAAILTGGNYWLASVWLSLVSFLGSWYLFAVVLRFFPDSKWAAAFAFLFFPSVVFWGSGVIKESVALGAMMTLAAFFLKIMMRDSPRWFEWALAVVSVWLAWNLKYYWIAAFLPVACTTLVIQAFSVRIKVLASHGLVSWLILFAALCLVASLLHPNFHPQRLLMVVVENNKAFAANSGPTDLIHYNNLEPTWPSLMLNSPWALISGVFRPFFWEADNVLKLITAGENLVVLVLFVSSAPRVRNLFNAPNRLLTLSVIVFSLVLCVFLALSTPNFGSLARYKVGFLPFLIFLLAYRNPLFDYIRLMPFLKRTR